MKDHHCKTMPENVRIFYREYIGKDTRFSNWTIEKPIPIKYQILSKTDLTVISKCPYCKIKLPHPKRVMKVLEKI